MDSNDPMLIGEDVVEAPNVLEATPLDDDSPPHQPPSLPPRRPTRKAKAKESALMNRIVKPRSLKKRNNNINEHDRGQEIEPHASVLTSILLNIPVAHPTRQEPAMPSTSIPITPNPARGSAKHTRYVSNPTRTTITIVNIHLEPIEAVTKLSKAQISKFLHDAPPHLLQGIMPSRSNPIIPIIMIRDRLLTNISLPTPRDALNTIIDTATRDLVQMAKTDLKCLVRIGKQAPLANKTLLPFQFNPENPSEVLTAVCAWRSQAEDLYSDTKKKAHEEAQDYETSSVLANTSVSIHSSNSFRYQLKQMV